MQGSYGRAGWQWPILVAVVIAGAAVAHEEDEDTDIPDVETFGSLGKLIPWHKDAIHISVVWPEKKAPQLCYWMRPSEWRATDLIDPNAGSLGTKREDFRRIVYGGYRFSNTLEDSVLTRIKADLQLENTLCAELPGALTPSDEHHIEALTPADFAANAQWFKDAGHSRGLNYNLFCGANVMLADGRIAAIGGHDKSGNHGIRKINIYDPEKERWLERPQPQAMTNFFADPSFAWPPEQTGLYEVNTDPADPADMKYQRWYPSAVTLPDGKVLILGGSDQVSEYGPDCPDEDDGPLPPFRPDLCAGTSKVRIATPEVYDPATDRNTALENARRLQPMYPRSFVIQTGHRARDWKVLSFGEVVPPLPVGYEIDGYDPFEYRGITSLLDVQAALADPKRGVPAENHWQPVGTAASAHDSGAAVNLRYLDKQGLPQLQKVIAFGGGGENGDTDVIESISFELIKGNRGFTTAGWKVETGKLPFALDQNNAVVLPDGNVLVFGGNGRVGRRRQANLDVQLFDTATGAVTTVATTNIPRHDHSNGTLLPDGTVLISGGNRVDLSSDEDAAVPVAQLYSPAYLFKGDRPEVKWAPGKVRYGKKFAIKLAGKPTIGQVALLRIGPTTHNWSWGNEYVRLSFQQDGGWLKVSAPKVPGAAIPGLYMLYVLDEDGVPSVARRVLVGEKLHSHFGRDGDCDDEHEGDAD